ncbi:SDR family NAD(P)-dependent oxidoreductase [Halococcus agarilyticus]|uniref:SDR family NAD(P)-dependent oxidoreductase n=1 Tax=Halococcus agarilyticus TaxID=1232219 RepID=UPI000677B23B|nr:SDR family NAD(P)-dependent oxidoreductase [Halococcus agarilyticus]
MNHTTAGELDGKAALVTGASSGIGAATAEALAAEGASVSLAARRTDRLDELAERIEASGGNALAITADVTEEADIEAMIETTTDAFGGLDVLVNNAGVMLLAPVERADADDWRRMVSVNLTGLMNTTRAALPALREDEAGHVVNISSDARRGPGAGFGAYAATKAGVSTFAESLREEVADDGVRVTTVEPGATDTELPAHITDAAAKDEVEAAIESMRTLESTDVAAAVRYAVTQPPRVNVDELLVRPTDAG